MESYMRDCLLSIWSGPGPIPCVAHKASRTATKLHAKVIGVTHPRVLQIALLVI